MTFRSVCFALCFALASGCAGSTPIQRAAEAYGIAVLATEAAAEIVENPDIDLDVRKAIVTAEKYSTPAAQSLRVAAVGAIQVAAAVEAGVATKDDLKAAYAIVIARLADLQEPLSDLLVATGALR